MDFLTTNIGRGHRFYLEGLYRALKEIAPDKAGMFYTAPEASTGSGRGIWRMIGSMYRSGSSTGPLGSIYSRLRRRKNPTKPGITERLIGASFSGKITKPMSPLIVDHPLLALSLREVTRRPLIYMHGELVAPPEARVSGIHSIIIPTTETREAFESDSLNSIENPVEFIESGLCIERTLVSQGVEGYRSRKGRLIDRARLNVALFSSGAEPKAHCEIIIASAESLLHENHNPHLYVKSGGRLQQLAEKVGLQYTEFRDIETEEKLAGEAFQQWDAFIAPAHERVNWAYGLGLPMFAIEPDFGTFAPLNRNLVRTAGVARSIDSLQAARRFGERLTEPRDSGELMRMNRSPRADIHGFENSARWLVERF